jgi:AbrB family looped-hinge helix DNA binding protein
MEVAITTMSQNGQIVIPSGIRKEAGLKPSSKFMIINEGKDIILRHLNEQALKEEIEFLRSISRGMADIKAGRYTVADTNMSKKEILALLEKKKK